MSRFNSIKIIIAVLITALLFSGAVFSGINTIMADTPSESETSSVDSGKESEDPDDSSKQDEPASPSESSTDEDPSEPTEPSSKEDPTEPSSKEEPTEPTEPATKEDPTEPTEPSTKDDPSEPTEPATKEDPTEPAEPSSKEDPTRPTENPSKQTEPSTEEPAEEPTAEPTEPATKEDPASPTEPSSREDPTRPTENPSRPTEPSTEEPTEEEPTEEPTEPVDPITPEYPEVIPTKPGIYGIEISHERVQYPADAELQLTVELLTRGDVTTTVTWTSSDPSVATVTQTGLVHTLKYGQTVITATTTEGYSASCSLQTRFADVNDPSMSSYKPIYWAADNGITAVEDYFMPYNTVTRQQTVIFLWRIAGRPEVSSDVRNIFSDISESTPGYKAIMWAVSLDIIRGFDDGTFRPEDPVLRNQMAIMLWRWQGRPDVETSYNPFADVDTSISWCRAVMWGAENGIIRGANGNFMPWDDCQRQHIAIFLYRYARDMLGRNVTSSALRAYDEDIYNLVLPSQSGVFYSNRVYGVDISYYQGKVDYEKLKADNIRFVIFREGYYMDVDPSFYENVKAAQAAGLWIPGVYHFCYAENKKEALAEAKACVEHVKKAGLDKDTIIFMDFEYDTVDSAARDGVFLGKEECIEFTQIFCDYVSSQGYPAGIYTNKDYYYRMYDKEIIDRYVTWLAIYPNNLTSYAPSLESEFAFWQYSGSGRVDGIDNYVDLNVYFMK